MVSPSCQLDSLSHVTWPLDLTVVDQRKAVTGPVACCMVVSLSCSRGDICSRGSCPIVRGLHDATNLLVAFAYFGRGSPFTDFSVSFAGDAGFLGEPCVSAVSILPGVFVVSCGYDLVRFG